MLGYSNNDIVFLPAGTSSFGLLLLFLCFDRVSEEEDWRGVLYRAKV